jgi:hypothetical protein
MSILHIPFLAGLSTNLKTEILSISVAGMFPRVVRVPPRSRQNLYSCGYSWQTNCGLFVRSLWGTPGHIFSRWSHRPSLQSN